MSRKLIDGETPQIMTEAEIAAAGIKKDVPLEMIVMPEFEPLPKFSTENTFEGLFTKNYNSLWNNLYDPKNYQNPSGINYAAAAA